jgi:phosphoribosylformylglycinamidine synthase
MKPKAIVLRGAGTNCQYETEFALKQAGFEARTVHINELMKGREKLAACDLLTIPGGFSYGDYLGAGKVLANKITFSLGTQMHEFVDSGRPVIGICNGFQVLVKTGLLPGFDTEKKQQCTLTINESGNFRCLWVKLDVPESACPFTKGMETLRAPIAHAEGRFYAAPAVIERLFSGRQVVFRYAENPNGSVRDIAGICSKSGLVLGMMPHPERNISALNEPLSADSSASGEGAGMQIFRNVYDYLKK